MQHTNYDDGTSPSVQRCRLHGHIDAAVNQMCWAFLIDATSSAYRRYQAVSATMRTRYSPEGRAQLGEVTDADMARLQTAARQACSADDLPLLLAALNTHGVQWSLMSVPNGEGGATWFAAELSAHAIIGVWAGHGQTETTAIRAALAQLAAFYVSNRTSWKYSLVRQQELAYVERLMAAADNG